MTTKMKYRWRDERGAVAILVGFALIVLLGFTALAVDMGALAAEKRKMVTAADAAVLAGAQELLTTLSSEQAKIKAHEFADSNGFIIQEGDIQITGGRIAATVSEDVDTFFARILGSTFQRVKVMAVAVAELENLWDGNPTIVSYKEDADNALELKGSFTTNLDGQDALVHSNGGLQVKENVTKQGSGDVLGTSVLSLEDKKGFFDDIKQVQVQPAPLSASSILHYLEYWKTEGFDVKETGKTKLKNATVNWNHDVVYVDGDLSLEENSQLLGGAVIIVSGKVELKGNAYLEGVIYALSGNGVEFKEAADAVGNTHAGVIKGAVLSNDKVELKDSTSLTVEGGTFDGLVPVYVGFRLVQ